MKVKNIVLPEEQIVGMLGWRQGSMLSLPVIRSLPRGYRVLRVGHDFHRYGFVVTVEHPSFPEVESGVEIPVIESNVLSVNIDVKALIDLAIAVEKGEVSNRLVEAAQETLVTLKGK